MTLLLPLRAEPGPRIDLSGQIIIDGFTSDFLADEAIFGINDEFVILGVPCVVGGEPECPPEEGVSDSQWGLFNDVNQIHVTWDAKFLYIGLDGVTWNNNVMLFFDSTRINGLATDRGPGLPSMLDVNAWARKISFANRFQPDFFLATWDNNQTPQMWRYESARNVVQVSSFETAASFSGNALGRAMEAAIPWSVVFQSDSTVVSPAYGDTVPVIPARFDTLRIAACITAGGDNTGSPDSAPDNFSGHQVDGNAPATIDNFAVIPLDLMGATTGSAPDRIPDMPGAGQSFEVPIKDRVSFLKRPPIIGITFSLQDVSIRRGVVSPEEGFDLEFSVQIAPELPPVVLEGRSVSLTAEIYDVRGAVRRVLYRDRRIPVSEVGSDTPLNRWDGRDETGQMVGGGVYILRVVLEPDQGKAQRSFAVIR